MIARSALPILAAALLAAALAACTAGGDSAPADAGTGQPAAIGSPAASDAAEAAADCGCGARSPESLLETQRQVTSPSGL